MYRNFNHQGFIELIVGGMFAGKTQELLRRVFVLQRAGQRVLLFKPSFDSRNLVEKRVESHDSRYVLEAITIQSIGDFIKAIEREDVRKKKPTLAFDEIQFFPPEFVPVLERLANRGFRIICAGLDRGFNDQIFATVMQLLSFAEFITKLHAVCVLCGETATKTQRIDDNKRPVAPKNVSNVIGGSEAYQARCRNCFVFFPE